MTDETRDKLKDIVKKKPLQTAILKTPEYDRGFEQGRKDGWNEAVEAMIGMHQQLIDMAQNRIDQILMVSNEIDADRAAFLRAAITNSGEAINKLESLRK